MTIIGKRIAALRREKGFTQDELAEKLGVTPQAVSKWENDQTCPDISLLPQLAKILGISVDELLSGEKKEDSPAVRMVPESERKSIDDMMLRIVVNSKDNDKVRVNLPLALLKVAVDNGMNMSQISSNDVLKSIDLVKILELVEKGVIGNLVEVESGDGDTVHIFVE